MASYGHHSIDDDDIAAVVKVMKEGLLTQGSEVTAFETTLAGIVGAKYAVSCSSGTAALHLAGMAINLDKTDTVVVPANTFVASANAVRLTGAEVIFCDIDAGTGLMDLADLRSILSSDKNNRITAIMPVYFGGQCQNPSDLWTIASHYRLKIIEDACHALGSTYLSNGRQNAIGSCLHSTMCAFSFHPVKTIAMGEGGAVTTNSEELCKKLLLLRNHALIRNPDEWSSDATYVPAQGRNPSWYYEINEISPNYRASDIHCALGRSQLSRLQTFVQKRRALVSWYDKCISDLYPHIVPLQKIATCEPAWHLYVLLIDFERYSIKRQDLMAKLKSLGIGSQVHYIPVPWQPYYRKRYPERYLPGTCSFFARCLSLPLFPTMNKDDVEFIVTSLKVLLGIKN